MSDTPEPAHDLVKQVEEASSFLYRFHFHNERFTSRDVNSGIDRLQALGRDVARTGLLNSKVLSPFF